MASRSLFRTLPIARRAFAVRSYATAPVTPPVQLFGVDGTYASALYTAGAKESSLDAISGALTSLKSLIEKDGALSTVLANPALSASDKTSVVASLTKTVPNVPAVGNLLSLLAENNRLSLLGSIIDSYAILISAYKGEVEATVTTAAPLESKFLSRIEAAIKKSEFVGAGKSLKVVNKINPDILGGIVVEVGDRTVDLSLANKIARLNTLLTEAI
ncbi:OSCP/delta subunit of ATPase [Lipomyces oligophaga]|uniref:OSCP/delta subunit of ATPase n=1 Tax=Lipomyces oligophaga TaxID=45792 RepID=UPI0034CF3731